MRLEFLGTGGYHPNESRHTACLMLPEAGIVFDAGTSIFRIADRLLTEELSVCLTHAHLDHVVGLTYLLEPMLSGALSRVRVYGREKVLAAVRTHLFSEPLFPVMPEFEFHPLRRNTRPLACPGVEVLHAPLKSHPGGSTAFRVNWQPEAEQAPRSFAYVTDTTVDGSYTDFIRGVDVLVHECYFPDDQQEWAKKTGHSYASAVAELATEAHVGRLYLTHIDPHKTGDDPVGLESIRQIFPRTELAFDGLQVSVQE